MDALLVVDKPAGPTSHEVVARVRRALGERRVGHTGTLDPMATGVLPLLLGRATRLARFLSRSGKSYDAVIRLGVATDTYDAEGIPTGVRHDGPFPPRDAIDRALEVFRGTFLQQPPAFSAKKIGGRRSYDLARAASIRLASTGAGAPAPGGLAASAGPPALPAPVPVTAAIEVLHVEGEAVTLRIACSAGFYVRALAHDLGRHLGVGAHLAALRRTRSGDFMLSDAIALDRVEREPDDVRSWVVAPARLLPAFPAVTLTEAGVHHAAQGRDLGLQDVVTGAAPGAGASGLTATGDEWFRLVDSRGGLVAVARRAQAPALWHPAVVLV